MRVQHGLQCIRDLLADPFLYGKTPGEQPHQAGELGNANDVLVSDVTNISRAIEWKRVVFAQSKEADRALDNLADPAVRFPGIRYRILATTWGHLHSLRWHQIKL